MSAPSVYLASLGCPKNLVDSEVMLGKMLGKGFGVSQDPSTAEVIVVNTCSFIEGAKQESIDTILEMAGYKDSGNCQKLVVAGCLSQRYSKELEAEIPEIDILMGTGQYQNIIEALDSNGKKRSYVDQPAFIHTENDERILSGPSYSSYLKLSEGCDRKCTFCIIPKLRGSVRSRSIESLVIEARRMAARGVRELNLIAQDLTHYGIDRNDGTNLQALLKALCQVEELRWIRLHYVYPDQLEDEVMQLIASEEKIVPYLDMPIQHTNDRMLRLMGRKLRKKRLIEVIERLRSLVPSIVFRTSIIVGFPGETDAEFEDLYDDLKSLKLDYVGVFKYSQEENTPAAILPDQLPQETKDYRYNRLTEMLALQASRRSADQVGEEREILLEGLSDESDLLLQGRLSTQAAGIDGKVLINDLGDIEPSHFQPGLFAKVKITDSNEHDFVAEVKALLA